MRNVVGRAWEITKASIRMLRKHPRLLVLPLLSLAVTLAIMGSLGVLVACTGLIKLHSVHVLTARYVACLVPAVFVLSFIVGFFQVAFTRAVMRTLRDEEPTLADSLAFAVTRIPALLGYALMSGTVGLVLSIVERYTARLGGFATRLFFGVSWSLATFVVFPVLVQERRGIVDSLRRSGTLMNQTWGESFLGDIGFIAIFLMIGAPIIGLFALGEWVVHTHLALGVSVIAVGAAIYLGFAVVGTAVRSLYSIALYQFAVEGVAPAEFGVPALDAVWKVK